jgi:hypothetical protein
MDDKEKLELYEKLDCLKKEERQVSDKSYAEKRVQVIVYTFVAMGLVALMGALFNLVVIK